MEGAALVTGGAKRIGRAVALALARKGYDLGIHYNTSGARAEELAAEIGSLGRQCELFQFDLADAKSLPLLIERAFEALPNCSVLVNNASVFERVGFMDTDEALFDRMIAINFKAPFFLSQHFVRRCGPGAAAQIINLLDTQITRNFTQYFVYALSKKAMAEFTRMAARELGPAVRVNGVCPGLIAAAAGSSQESFRKMASRIPAKRTGEPRDVAEAVLYLLDSDFVTGECIFVDGGEHLT